MRDFDIVAYLEVDRVGNRRFSVTESERTKAKCRSQALKSVSELPLNLTEWIKIINEGTKFGEDVVLETVSEEAPTDNAKTIWEELAKNLIEDSSEDKKTALLKMIKDSQKINDQEKVWLSKKVLAWA